MDCFGILQMHDSSISVAKALIRRQTLVPQALETQRRRKQELPTAPQRQLVQTSEEPACSMGSSSRLS